MLKKYYQFELGQVCSRLSSGKGIAAKEISEHGVYPVFGGNGLRGYSDRKNFEGQCAIIGRQGAFCGNVRFFSGEAYMTEHAVVVCANEKSDIKYLSYLLGTLNLGRLSGQSAQPGLSVKTLSKQVIQLPDISKQRQIAKVLSAFDEKIELNTQINHNLEEQAKAIFKSWFLDFSALDNPDFYSYEGVTCPVGWRVSYLADIADYLNGLAMQKYRPDEGDFGYPVLKIKELRQRMCDKDSERCSFHIKPEYIVHDGDVIFSWSGSLLVDFWCGGECGLNQHLFKVSSTKYDKWFYYSWTQYHLNEFIAIAADKATTMGHIKREHLQSATVLVPPADIYNEIGKLLGPIYEAITRNRIESKMLAQLRDSLLPKLMSGEIDVSEVEV